MTYQEISTIIKSKSDKELELLTKSELYVFLKIMKDEMTRRLTPRQRGKHNKRTTILPVPKDVYEGCKRLTMEWIRRKNTTIK